MCIRDSSKFPRSRTLESSSTDKDNPIQTDAVASRVRLQSPGSEQGLGFTSQLVRYFLIDSGASFHVVGRNSLTKSEKDTIYDLKQTIKITTANGIVDVTQAVQVYSKELGLTVHALLMEGNTCVLSMGELCTTNEYDFVRRHERDPFLEKDGRRIYCNRKTTVSYTHLTLPTIYSV